MQVSEMMHKGVECVDLHATVTDVAKCMRDKDIGAIPVSQNGRLVGLVTDRDLALRAVAEGRDIGALTAGDVMTRDVFTCREHDSAAQVVLRMETRRVRRMPVVDDQDHVVGMVSLGDISHALAHTDCGEFLKAVSAHHR